MDPKDGAALMVKLEAESARLRQEIAEHQQRLADISTLIRLYTAFQPLFDDGPRQIGETVHNVTLALTSQSQTLPKRDRIVQASAQILADGSHLRTGQLLRELESRGIQVGGKNPVLNLSSYLSRAKDRFMSEPRSGGWALRQIAKEVRPGDAPTSLGLDVNSAVGRTRSAG